MKSLDADRLILDSRPSNEVEPPLSSWTQTMATPQAMMTWMLEPGFKLVASGEDLKDYYFNFIVSQQRTRRNCIAFKLSRQQAMQFQCFPRDDNRTQEFLPCLQTLAMGDLNSVEFGQQSHMQLALATGLTLQDCLVLRGVAPRQHWAIGIVIDDFVCVEKIPMELTDPQEMRSCQIADTMQRAYAEVGLRANEKKRFRADAFPKFWGAAINGESGVIRAQLERTLPIAMVTAKLCALGSSSRKLLEIVAGAWTSIVQFKKRAMCLLSAVFADIQAHDYNAVFKMSPETVAELWCLVVLAPTFCTDLRNIPQTSLSMVDASDAWMAEVETDISSTLALELCRHSLTKASWTCLLSPLKALMRLHDQLEPEEEMPEGEEPVRAHPLWTELAKTKQFKNVGRRRVRRGQHINLSELDAMLQSEYRRAMLHPNSRLYTGSDSQVVLGAMIRGRSSSKAMNNRLRKSLPILLSQNCSHWMHYVNTRDNPADDSTRDKDVRLAAPEPEWLANAAIGDFLAMDAYLEQHGAGLDTIARLPSAPKDLPAIGALQSKALQRPHGVPWRAKTKVAKTPPVAAPPPRKPWLPERRLDEAACTLLDRIPESQFCLPRGKTLKDIKQYAGHLDLFSGSRGAARALANQTGQWVLCYDIKHSHREDLANKDIQGEIEALLQAQAFLSIGAGPVCSSFSRAVRPPVRSRMHPAGLPNLRESMKERVRLGNIFAAWLASLIIVAHEAGLCWWVENPRSSFLWWLPVWRKVRSLQGVAPFVTPYCRWGTSWQKYTIFLTNSQLGGQLLKCECKQRHIQLRGYSVRHGMSWTKVAEPYPKGISKLLAAAVTEQLKPAERRRRLDVAACARCSCRIGEASHPGPRPRRDRAAGLSLEEAQMIRPETAILQTRVHHGFLTWLQGQLTPHTWSWVVRQPQLQVAFLRRYGNELFNKGEPMYVFRHLVVLLQQQFPGERATLVQAWDLLGRWEQVQPVDHRTPLPKVLLDAMLALAITWKWYKWAAITSLAYHGATRIGEPLRARRRDLLLPHEAGLDKPMMFLNISAPKPGRRGIGKIQHSRIRDPTTVALAAFAFGSLQKDDQLYPASASTFRKRWDLLLQALRVPAKLALTPACCRPGGAVFLYHQDTPLQSILWQMRIRHLVTLEHYIQEVAAVNVLQQLPKPCLQVVKNFAKMLPELMRRFPCPNAD